MVKACTYYLDHENYQSLEDIISILKLAKEDGVVFNSISSGGVVPKSPLVYPGYQAELSREIKKENLAGHPHELEDADRRERGRRERHADPPESR